MRHFRIARQQQRSGMTVVRTEDDVIVRNVQSFDDVILEQMDKITVKIRNIRLDP